MPSANDNTTAKLRMLDILAVLVTAIIIWGPMIAGVAHA
jgi:hypothetical protein